MQHGMRVYFKAIDMKCVEAGVGASLMVRSIRA